MIFKNKNAQALTELTLFGSFFIMLLAVMVSYSMRYNSQQRVNQEAFRKGISKLDDYASPEGTSSITYLRYRDDYVPDPSNPFGLGSVEPSVSSAVLTRDFQMHMTADTDYSLPQIAIDIDGISSSCNSHLNKKYRDSDDENLRKKYGSEDSPCYYLSAGFRVDEGVSRDANTFNRYAQIYGESSLQGCNEYKREDDSCPSRWKDLYKWDDDDGEWEVNDNLHNPFALRMIDSSGGEIMEYGAAVAQCRRIVDDNVCEDECNEGKSKNSKSNCAKICAKKVKVPWYCEKSEEVDPKTHRYQFQVLDRLFGITNWDYKQGNPTPLQTVGVQTNYEQQSDKDGTADYINEEESSSVKNSVNLSSGWTDTVKRRVIFVPYKPNRDSVDEDEDEKDDLTIEDLDHTVEPDISSFTWETAR